MAHNDNLMTAKGPSSGFRFFGIYARLTSGDHKAGLWRGFGGPTATHEALATDQHMHLAVAETYDDDWQVTVYTVDDSPSVQLCVTPLANRKAITLTLKGTAGASVYFGKTTAVTASAAGAAGTYGMEVMLDASGYATATFPFGPNMTLWAITSAGATVTIRATEVA